MKKIGLFLIFAFAVITVSAQSNTTTNTGSQNKKASINIADLQKSITDYITKEYADYNILEAYNLVKGKIAYQVVLNKNDKKLYLYFDKDGIYLSKREGMVKKSMPVSKKSAVKSDQSVKQKSLK